MKRSVLALDFGASSGRAILATYDGTAIHLQEVHRFVNEPLLENGHLFWNVPELMNQLEIGLQKAFLLGFALPVQSAETGITGIQAAEHRRSGLHRHRHLGRGLRLVG